MSNMTSTVHCLCQHLVDTQNRIKGKATIFAPLFTVFFLVFFFVLVCLFVSTLTERTLGVGGVNMF